ncbi:Aldehyde/histidinol dehydrogenase [Mycena alexandri]|uniref:Aldehyde dehydrogenase n=1 Tax=Mycena alexandri TaxID=1745969 RepID=A0AAD6TDJ0_9AGAR|nr:Aldehyde/histidinol dehydrogenase [Mycena alexandri]KAJ7042363.1 Aldehyde/histidinol dehydrogenase [Mycena alexandri]
MPLEYTSLESLQGGYAELQKSFQTNKTLPLSFRRAQLLQLARMFQENSVRLTDALTADLGRHKLEIFLPEIAPVVSGAVRAAESLEEWNKPERPQVEAWRSSWDTTIYPVAKGVVLIIGPWNYPYATTMLPLIGAIAAGCTCIVKPSEFSSNCAQLLAELFPKYLDQTAYRIVNGATAETTALLDLKWDHIFFTGSEAVGQIVAAGVVRNVTPLTLELGSKSPVFVDAGKTDLELAAKRILWGKQQNAGQICVAPDYILVPRTHQDALIKVFKKAYHSLWPHPKGAVDRLSEMGAILNSAHHKRIRKLLDRTQGTLVHGGNTEGTKRIEPALVANVGVDDALMESENFGPIIPLVPVDDVHEAIKIIRGHRVPLVIYVFTDSEETKDKFLTSTRSGTLVLNDTFVQLSVHEMPFGGQGDSGYGSYLHKFSFDTFVHRRSFINVPPTAEPLLQNRYPPYTEAAFEALSAPANIKIPDN